MNKQTFSLFDFCKKKADKVQFFGEESLDLYCRIPFKKANNSNKDIQRLAKLLGRTVNSFQSEISLHNIMIDYFIPYSTSLYTRGRTH